MWFDHTTQTPAHMLRLRLNHIHIIRNSLVDFNKLAMYECNIHYTLYTHYLQFKYQLSIKFYLQFTYKFYVWIVLVLLTEELLRD